MTEWVEFDNPDSVAVGAADRIQKLAAQSIQARGRFRLVLAGGTTPLSCYRLLAERQLDLSQWELFYGDERCLPEHDPQRNHQMVIATGLARQAGQHHVIPAELGPQKGSESYQALISGKLPFDLVILGMGEDGHTASLFPDHDWSASSPGQWVKPVDDSPKPPPQRISLTLQALQSCLHMLVLVTGQSKRGALNGWKQGNDLPVAKVADVEQCQVYVERGLL